MHADLEKRAAVRSPTASRLGVMRSSPGSASREIGTQNITRSRRSGSRRRLDAAACFGTGRGSLLAWQTAV